MTYTGSLAPGNTPTELLPVRSPTKKFVKKQSLVRMPACWKNGSMLRQVGFVRRSSSSFSYSSKSPTVPQSCARTMMPPTGNLGSSVPRFSTSRPTPAGKKLVPCSCFGIEVTPLGNASNCWTSSKSSCDGWGMLSGIVTALLGEAIRCISATHRGSVSVRSGPQAVSSSKKGQQSSKTAGLSIFSG